MAIFHFVFLFYFEFFVVLLHFLIFGDCVHFQFFGAGEHFQGVCDCEPVQYFGDGALVLYIGDGARLRAIHVDTPMDKKRCRLGRLIAFDYTDTRHVVSSWKTTQEGHQYASHVAGYKFADRKLGTIQKEQWYQTDILDLVPLKALPGNLK